MDNKSARNIVATLTPQVVAALEDHIKHRIEQHRLILERASNIEEVKTSQGAIHELKILKKIREDALKIIALES